MIGISRLSWQIFTAGSQTGFKKEAAECDTGLHLIGGRAVIAEFDYENPIRVLVPCVYNPSSLACAGGGEMADAAGILLYREDSRPAEGR